MLDRRYAIKIKIKSLAAEARIIRFEERRQFSSYVKHDLSYHRRTVVRQACRAAQLAYGFLRGRTYHQLEAKCHEAPEWHRVQALVEKYGVLRQDDEGCNQFRDRKSRLLEEFKAWKTAKEQSADSMVA